ncbi:hypothetical protein D0869_11581 [Hortaea werneckii]|uniref:Uncharacterized protein n=1 Tax=Hortaea werneckii TaxID=91943 RepID=A0A3M6XZI8_HORWE|nr:hypothetical protein KC324_g6880 [Hortaea werneckii]KAI7539548.1 hypothetical protein KC316_g15673 [Hortaea werneckii]RMX75484.1 hypothetical protein D0869_11581 [Hortaea werneckii]RMX95940.1 hypothetical protein D0868_11459 [Hortaea werneckii]
MAAAVSMGTAPGRVNNGSSAAEEEQLYAQLLQLQDTVIAGQHPLFKLPPAAIAQLKASLIVPDAAATNGAAVATNQQTLQSSPSTRISSLPGLHAQAAPVQPGPAAVSAFAAKSRGLDPIFLEKSSSLVRAEGQLKRQRIERDLLTQVEQRRHTARGGDPAAEGLSRIDIDAVLTAALSRVPPRSGLQSARPASASSFDENDYYSSQAPSEWSSDDDGSKHSDKGAGASTAGFERLNPAAAKATTGSHAHPNRIPQKRNQPEPFVAHSTKARSQYYPDHEPDDVDDAGDEDEDEEYTPPDAAAFDSARMGDMPQDAQQPTDVDDDNSDYEPGEITQDSTVLTPHNQQAPPAQPPAHVIRNHLTHLAAPQPNRVSPLTTAKGPGFELELVNGQPEVIQKERAPPRSMPMASRASTVSPANGGSGNKKKRAKKRKREQVRDEKATKRNKRPEDKGAGRQGPQTGQEPYIKDEPFSPPPLLANVPEAPQYPPPQFRPAPAHVDLSSPSQPQHLHYAPEQPRAPLRYEHAPAASPAVLRVASPTAYQPKQRDTQDLRRMASLQYAQKASSPPQQARAYSPVGPYQPRYQEGPHVQEMQYVRAPSPRRQPEYQEGYSRAQSPAIMPPPPPKRIIVDQYGNRYYAADPGPAPATAVSARASVAPVDRRFEHQPTFERASSRLAYAPQPPTRYEPSYSAVPPLSQPPARRYEQPVEYIDSNGYRVRQQPEPTSPTYQPQPRYEAMPPPPPPPAPAEPTSPVYREVPRYDQMLPPPPPQPPREPTSPVYQQASRAYSMRPEVPAPAGCARQASVAPAPYARQEMPPPAAPPRAVSVMPGGAADYPQYAPQPSYGYAPAPQPVKYVDQYGREMYPQQLRPASEFRYQ